MKKCLGAGVGLLLALSLATAQEPMAKPAFPESKRLVMTWVPPYAVSKSLAWLRESFDGVGMKDGLTHLGLQFWTPTLKGGLKWPDKETNDAAVSDFREWGHAHGVRMMLCVYNGAKKWDWPLARAGFAEHPQEFADALIAEMERLGLDGVDLDLEGNGEFEKDKAAYVQFVGDLSRRLHTKGKHLTADTFCHIWNAPNQRWWQELLPLVDGLTTMGYDEIGAAAPEWRSYAAQQKAAGDHAGKLMIGMPTHKADWQGGKALDQLKWVRENGNVGVALWDAQLESEVWRTADLWKMLAEIRGAR